MRNVLVPAIVACLAGCAAQPALVKDTASGRAEATFPGVTIDRVRDELVLVCTKTGGEVKADAYTVTCGKRDDSNRALLAQALIGNAFSQTPWQHLQFTMAPVSGGVFVTALSYMEMTMGFGEKKRIEQNGNAVRNQLQAGLDAAAARLTGPAEAATKPPTPAPPACASCAKIGKDL